MSRKRKEMMAANKKADGDNYKALTKGLPDYVVDWVSKVEGVCGLNCTNLRQLKDGASKAEIENAYASDVSFFQGVIADLENLTGSSSLDHPGIWE
tara:strand:+ start:433 stop:720 length:288 start_codon:yes stop_codon:yes gene_type:complete